MPLLFWSTRNSPTKTTMGMITFEVTFGSSEVTRMVENNRRKQLFSIIADKSAEVSNKEQSSLYLRSVDENLNAFKDFLVFYQLENIKSDTIVHVTKEILIRMKLRYSNCRGQAYDGASNMMGKHSKIQKGKSQNPLPYTIKNIFSAYQ